MRQGDPQVTFQPRGRLGNLLFETAACIGYAKKHNVVWGVPRNANREVPRFFEFFPGLPICDSHFRGYQEHKDDSFCQQHNTNKGRCWFNHHEIPFHPQGVTLQGFWQSWKYFENAEEEVKKVFRLKQDATLYGWVSIHVRRGDYVDYANSFPPITKEYIVQAAELMASYQPLGFIFFSDDIAWCKSLFTSAFGEVDHTKPQLYTMAHLPCLFSEGKSEIEDLAMMASCSHHIIANSTFSWWGAYLGHNPDKVVISPSHKRGNWFGHSSGVSTDCIDLIPPTWHQIEFR